MQPYPYFCVTWHTGQCSHDILLIGKDLSWPITGGQSWICAPLSSWSLLFVCPSAYYLTSPWWWVPSLTLSSLSLPCGQCAQRSWVPRQSPAVGEPPQRCKTAPSSGWTTCQVSQELCGKIRQLDLNLLFLSEEFLFQEPTAIFMASIDFRSEGSKAAMHINLRHNPA